MTKQENAEAWTQNAREKMLSAFEGTPGMIHQGQRAAVVKAIDAGNTRPIEAWLKSYQLAMVEGWK